MRQAVKFSRQVHLKPCGFALNITTNRVYFVLVESLFTTAIKYYLDCFMGNLFSWFTGNARDVLLILEKYTASETVSLTFTQVLPTITIITEI